MTQKTQLWLVRTALISALYVALTVSFSAVSYGPIQFRISEILVLFPLWNRKWTPGVVLGTIIANFFSPLGMMDVLFGSGATLVAVILMTRLAKISNNYYALLAPILANGFIIAIELTIVYGLPYWESVLFVGISEAIILFAGYRALALMARNSYFEKMLKAV